MARSTSWSRYQAFMLWLCLSSSFTCNPCNLRWPLDFTTSLETTVVEVGLEVSGSGIAVGWLLLENSLREFDKTESFVIDSTCWTTLQGDTIGFRTMRRLGPDASEVLLMMCGTGRL